MLFDFKSPSFNFTRITSCTNYDGEDGLNRSCERELGVEEERNILHTVKRKNANWIGHRLRTKTRTGWKDRRDGRMRKKTYVATGRP